MAIQRGYSLIELMIALSLLTILLLLGWPSLHSQLQRAQLDYASNALWQSAAYARSRAIQYGRETALCPRDRHDQCQTSSHWESGWVVIQTPLHSSQARVLRVQQALPGVLITTSLGRPQLRFHADGSAEGSNLSWIVCDPPTSTETRRVIVARSGRIRIETQHSGLTSSCRP